MKTEIEIKEKLQEIKKGLYLLENKIWIRRKDAIQIEFHKNNIAFIEWVLDENNDKNV